MRVKSENDIDSGKVNANMKSKICIVKVKSGGESEVDILTVGMEVNVKVTSENEGKEVYKGERDGSEVREIDERDCRSFGALDNDGHERKRIREYNILNVRHEA